MLPLFLLALLVALCVQLLLPFVGLLVWTIILAICFKPLHERLMVKRGMSSRRSAVMIGIGLSALVLVPTAIAAISAASSIPELVATIQSGDRQVPPPPARLKELPVVGERAHATWTQASTDMPAFAKKYGAQIASFHQVAAGDGRWIVHGGAGPCPGDHLCCDLPGLCGPVARLYRQGFRSHHR